MTATPSVSIHRPAGSCCCARPISRNVCSAFADRIESIGGRRPCRAFRPHAGWRGGQMYEGLREADYQLVGWGWMLWDFNWFRARDANSTFHRLAPRVSDGDIIVMHDGDESAPTRDQRHTVEATRRLDPRASRPGDSRSGRSASAARESRRSRGWCRAGSRRTRRACVG